MSVTVVERACRLLEQEERLNNQDLAAALGLSPGYLQRVFKKTVGVTPQQYRRRVVAERARDALGAADSVTASVYRAGYSSASRFYDGVGQELGMPPARARAGGPGERIDYAIAPCSLGQALVAWTMRGVCQVAFGDTAEGLAADVQERFPHADVRVADDHAWVRAVIDSVETATPAEVPLDIRGTAFQERVWQALRAIPRGETRSYAALAEAIGRPTAARAVARACATNALAVVIPCHRVVRSDGSLSGYRWGVERKATLLERERS